MKLSFLPHLPYGNFFFAERFFNFCRTVKKIYYAVKIFLPYGNCSFTARIPNLRQICQNAQNN